MNKKKLSILFITSIMLFSMTGCSMKNDSAQIDIPMEEPNISQMKSVCELATLECFYHNTAKLDTPGKFLFWNTNKKLWIEYSGVVTIGIDISSLDMKMKNNTVTITMPDAKVLSSRIDETSLTENSFYAESKGIGGSSIGAGKITAEDQSQAFEEAQKNMQEEAQKDATLLLQAKGRAQTLLQNYVKNIGEAIGVEYDIQWKDATDTDN